MSGGALRRYSSMVTRAARPRRSGLLEHVEAGVGQVVELASRQVAQGGQPRVLEQARHQGLVAPEYDGTGPDAGQQPHGVLDGRPDEPVGLVRPAPGEALLAPATGGGARLDVAGAHLVGGEALARGDAHGIPTASHEDDGERVVVEPLHAGDPLRTVGVVGCEPLEPAVEARGGDLDDAAGHELRIRC